MYSRYTVSLVMPCFNEEQGLALLLRGLPAYIDEVVIADNNSTDATAAVARAAGCRVVPVTRQGYGHAYQAGLVAAQGDIVVAMDADGTYPLAAAAGFIDEIAVGAADFVSGNRFAAGRPRTMPLLNYCGNRGLTVAARWLCNVSLQDSQSGMWVFKRAIMAAVSLRSGDMGFSQEIKLKAATAGFTVIERPISYAERAGAVKLHRWKDGARNIRALVALRRELRRNS